MSTKQPALVPVAWSDGGEAILHVDGRLDAWVEGAQLTMHTCFRLWVLGTRQVCRKIYASQEIHCVC